MVIPEPEITGKDKNIIKIPKNYLKLKFAHGKLIQQPNNYVLTKQYQYNKTNTVN